MKMYPFCEARKICGENRISLIHPGFRFPIRENGSMKCPDEKGSTDAKERDMDDKAGEATGCKKTMPRLPSLVLYRKGKSCYACYQRVKTEMCLEKKGDFIV